MTDALFTPEYPDGLPVGAGWVGDTAYEDVTFPYDGSLVAPAPVGNRALAERAVAEALAVREEVGRLPSHVRRAALFGAHEAIAARQADFEQLLVLETGKPLVDCRVEVARTLLTLQTAAEEVARLHGETVPLDLLPSGEGLLGFWVRKPIGVVVGIAGFNYPLLLAAHKIAPALAAGCPVIAKPAPQTRRAPAPTACPTHSRTRSVERSSIRADTRVAGSRGSPVTTCPIRPESRARKSSRTDSTTTTRCTLMQACPEA